MGFFNPRKPRDDARLLARLFNRLSRGDRMILARLEAIMARFDDVDALLNGINDATNAQAVRLSAVAADIAELIAGLSGGAITDAQMAELAAKAEAIKVSLDDEVAALEALGANPDNPIPEP